MDQLATTEVKILFGRERVHLFALRFKSPFALCRKDHSGTNWQLAEVHLCQKDLSSPVGPPIRPSASGRGGLRSSPCQLPVASGQWPVGPPFGGVHPNSVEKSPSSPLFNRVHPLPVGPFKKRSSNLRFDRQSRMFHRQSREPRGDPICGSIFLPMTHRAIINARARYGWIYFPKECVY